MFGVTRGSGNNMTGETVCSEFINEVFEGGDTNLETLTSSDLGDESLSLGAFLKRISVKEFPMGEDALREGTAGGGGTESLGETEGLGDGKEGFHVDERGSGNGVLSIDNTSSLGEALVDATNGVIGALDLDKEDGLLESWLGGQLGSVHDTSGSGDDLTTTSVDSIGVKGHISDVETNTTHVLVSHGTLLGGPLEGGLHGVLDFLQVLHLLGDIDQNVRAGGVWAEAPDLLGIIGVPLEFVLEDSSSLLDILLGADLVLLDGDGKFIGQRFSIGEDSVMLVGGLGKRVLGGLLSDGLVVRDDGVSLSDWALGEFLLEILKADLNVELTATGDDVLTVLLSSANDERIGLGELAETFDELGQVRGVGDVDGDTHDRGHGVLHDLDAVSFVVVRDGTLLHEVLIDTDEGDGVTARDIGDGLDLTAHHENSSLDVLDVEVVLGTGLVVRSHNSDLLSGLDGTGEDTAESVESTLIVGGHHLGDEDHKRTVLVTVLDGLTAGIGDGTFVELGGSVGLSFLGGGKLHDDHLKKSLGGIDPFLEDALEEILLTLLHLI